MLQTALVAEAVEAKGGSSASGGSAGYGSDEKCAAERNTEHGSAARSAWLYML